MVEIIDWCKDLYYVLSMEHQSALFLSLLWISCLFVPVTLIFHYTVMSRAQYVALHSPCSIKRDSSLFWFGTKKFLKLLQRSLHLDTIGLQLQACTSKSKDNSVAWQVAQKQAALLSLSTALFRNLPQFGLQMVEQFKHGYTVGLKNMLSLLISLLMSLWRIAEFSAMHISLGPREYQ